MENDIHLVRNKQEIYRLEGADQQIVPEIRPESIGLLHHW